MTDAPGLTPPPEDSTSGFADRARATAEDLSPRQRRQLKRLIALVTLALLVFLFVMQNRDEVSVSFILFTADTRLIWVMILCLAAGATGGYLAAGIIRRRRSR